VSTNYEEAVRRIEEVIRRIGVSREIDGEMKQVYVQNYLELRAQLEAGHMSENLESLEYRKMLDAEFLPSPTDAHGRDFDWVTGITGIAPDCHIPDDICFRVQ
jgi:hypothetical protein